MIAHVEAVADEREGEEGERAEGEDGGDGGGGVFFVGVDGALDGDDGGDSADAGAYGEEGGEFGAVGGVTIHDRPHDDSIERARIADVHRLAMVADRAHANHSAIVVAVTGTVYALGLHTILTPLLSWPLSARMAIAFTVILPFAAIGMPFPLVLRQLAHLDLGQIAFDRLHDEFLAGLVGARRRNGHAQHRRPTRG